MEDLIKALQILLKYENPDYPTWCEHDVLHIFHLQYSEVSLQDVKMLGELGFIVDEDEGGFKSFKYGCA